MLRLRTTGATGVAGVSSPTYYFPSWIAPLLLFAIAAGVRMIALDRAPDYDELYHVLAARGWLVDGVPRIAEGLYSRAQLFTILTALSFEAFGENLVVARLISVLASSLLVVAVFLWTKSVAGARSAWLAALLLCFSALSVQIAQFARFYALHGLAFWLGAVSVYALAERRPPWQRSLALAGGMTGSLLIALHLQALTLLGILGLSLWIAAATLGPHAWRHRHSPLVWGTVGGALVVLALVAAALPVAGALAPLVEQYRFAPLHAAESRDQFWFYHLLLLQRYPTLWSLVPLLALFALAARPKPATFCLTIFTVVVAILSFAGMKSQRYIVFVLPFLFVVFGIGLAYVWDGLVRTMRRALHQALPRVGATIHAVVLAGMALFLIGANGEWTKTALKLAGIDMRVTDEGLTLQGRQQAADWEMAVPYLKDAVAEAPVVVTTKDLFALYYFGRSDFALAPSVASEMSGGEFALDPRTGRPVIAEAQSLERIVNCYPQGVLLTDTYDWRDYFHANEQMRDLLTLRMEPLEVPVPTNARAFRWHASNRTSPSECASLPQPVRANEGPS